MSLVKLKKGESAIVLNFKDMPTPLVNRLYDIGISVGSQVTLLNILNFGQLYYISVDDVNFCIRKQEAKKLVVNII